MLAVETANVSYLQPVSFAWRPKEPRNRSDDFLLAVHPPAQFLSFGCVLNSYLEFVAMLMRHAFSSEWSLPLLDIVLHGTLRSVAVKLVRKLDSPCIAAVHGLLAANTQRCPRDSR